MPSVRPPVKDCTKGMHATCQTGGRHSISDKSLGISQKTMSRRRRRSHDAQRFVGSTPASTSAWFVEAEIFGKSTPAVLLGLGKTASLG
jgi:hypothetical protein